MNGRGRSDRFAGRGHYTQDIDLERSAKPEAATRELGECANGGRWLGSDRRTLRFRSDDRDATQGRALPGTEFCGVFAWYLARCAPW